MELGSPRNGDRAPHFLLMFLLISPHPLNSERGELYNLSEHQMLLHICQYVELVNYHFKKLDYKSSINSGIIHVPKCQSIGSYQLHL